MVTECFDANCLPLHIKVGQYRSLTNAYKFAGLLFPSRFLKNEEIRRVPTLSDKKNSESEGASPICSRIGKGGSNIVADSSFEDWYKSRKFCLHKLKLGKVLSYLVVDAAVRATTNLKTTPGVRLDFRSELMGWIPRPDGIAMCQNGVG